MELTDAGGADGLRVPFPFGRWEPLPCLPPCDLTRDCASPPSSPCCWS